MKKILVIKKVLLPLYPEARQFPPPRRVPGKNKQAMKKVYIFDCFTKKDITAHVTLAIGKGGKVHVFNAFGVDITENVFFGLE